jgi:hypothetical protein
VVSRLASAARSLGFLRHFFTAYPARTTLMVVLLVLAGMAEGIGVVALLPVLQVALDQEAADSSGLGVAVRDALSAIGLAP